MKDENSSEREISKGIGQYGSSGTCSNQGWAVFKWNVDHFVLEDGSNCKPGFVPPPPPLPTSDERNQIETFKGFRAIVCCVGGGATSSSSPS
jgi:hypothetical protein